MNILMFHLAPPQHQFSFFYSIAFIVALFLLLYEGYKRKFPLLPWILIVSFSQILFIIGTKLFALSQTEWSSMFRDHVLVEARGKELFGGVIMLGLGLWTGKKWMKFRPGIPDAFALVLPLSLTIQKAGCFFAGCCFGKPCTLPWAVEYPVNTLPHYHHFTQALIGMNDLCSLPVHPVQIYELLGALTVVILVLAFRKKWKSEGSSFFFSVSLYLIVRFAVEFFKDPLAHTIGGKMMGMLNQTQWGILIILPVLLFLLSFRELKYSPVQPFSQETEEHLPRPASVISFLLLSAVMITLLSGWFSRVEIGVILLFFVLSAVLTLRYIFVNYRKVRIRVAYICFLLLPFVLMGQMIPREVNDSVRIRKSKSVGIGFASGNFDNSFETYQGEGCDRIGRTGYFNQKYYLATAAINFRNENLTGKYEINYGLNLSFGNHTEKMLKLVYYPDTALPGNLNTASKRRNIMDVNPYVKFDTRWFGMGLGLHMGKLSFTYLDREKEDYRIPASGRQLISLYPQASLRVGPRDIAYFDYHLAGQFPSSLPGFRHMLGIGTGFGSDRGLAWTFGSLMGGSVNRNDDWDFDGLHFRGFYSNGIFPLKNGLILEPMLYFQDSPLTDKTQLQFSLGLRYEIGNKTITSRLPETK